MRRWTSWEVMMGTFFVSLVTLGYFANVSTGFHHLIQGYLNLVLPFDEEIKKQFLSRVDQMNAEKFNIYPMEMEKNPKQEAFQLSLVYHLNGEVQYESARSVLRGIAHLFIDSINKEDSIRKFLNKHPVEVFDITVSLWPTDEKDKVINSFVKSAKLHQGYIRYELSGSEDVTMALWEPVNEESLKFP